MTGLRVAQVAPLWTPVPPQDYGGTELMVHLLTEALVKRGCIVTLYAAGGSRTAGRLRSLCPASLMDLMAEGRAFEYEHYANAQLVDALAMGRTFDIIHCHLGYQQIPFSRLSPTPVLHTMHITPSVDDRWVLETFADVPVAAISRFQVARISPARRKSIRVIHNAVDFHTYDFRATAGSYLAFLGRMSPQKSPVDAIQIAKRADVPLVLAGAPQTADEARFFETDVVPRIDGQRVRYVGRVGHQQKNALLQNAAALLFPIQGDEAFGVAMIEAMACGTPVIARNRASVPEIIDQGCTGFYGDSIDELAACVHQAVALDRSRVREHAFEKFHIDRMVAEYMAAYADILCSEGRSTAS